MKTRDHPSIKDLKNLLVKTSNTSHSNLSQLLPTENNEILPCTELSFRKISSRQQQSGAQQSDILNSAQKSMDIIPMQMKPSDRAVGFQWAHRLTLLWFLTAALHSLLIIYTLAQALHCAKSTSSAIPYKDCRVWPKRNSRNSTLRFCSFLQNTA